MRALVKNISFRSELIVAPDPLDVDERALPLAKDLMLKRRNRQELILSK